MLIYILEDSRARGVSSGGRRIDCVSFVDNVAVLGEETREIQEMIITLNDRMTEYGMGMDHKKTE